MFAVVNKQKLHPPRRQRWIGDCLQVIEEDDL